MYKCLVFLHKSDDESVLNHFNNFTIKYFSELIGKEVKSGKVESSLLLEQKYDRFFEVTVNSKEKWDELMTTAEGRTLNKDLMDFHKFITVIFINYNEQK